jgi:signal transduction histidine kinase
LIEQIALDGNVLPASNSIRIQPGQANLEIHYTGLNFTRPEQLKFKYQLAGLDADWVDAGQRRTAYYSHLPPGNYDFKVIAANGNGVWNLAGASIRVVVTPPFHQTRWFYSLSLACLAGLALAGYKLRVRQLDRARAAQETFSQKLIATQEEERRRLAIELHDGLGQSLVIIKNRALLSLSTPGDHERAIVQIKEISEASSSALMEIRELASNLHPYQIDQFGLANALETMIERIADSSEIKFSHQIDAINSELPKEAQINLYRIVQESLNNIVKHSAATEARILLKKDSSVLHLLIEDNGKGFNLGAISNAQRGMGLTGIAERAKAIGAKPEIHSEPGQGTTITLNIGLKKLEDTN